jgi:hypothetical protein
MAISYYNLFDKPQRDNLAEMLNGKAVPHDQVEESKHAINRLVSIATKEDVRASIAADCEAAALQLLLDDSLSNVFDDQAERQELFERVKDNVLFSNSALFNAEANETLLQSWLYNPYISAQLNEKEVQQLLSNVKACAPELITEQSDKIKSVLEENALNIPIEDVKVSEKPPLHQTGEAASRNSIAGTVDLTGSIVLERAAEAEVKMRAILDSNSEYTRRSFVDKLNDKIRNASADLLDPSPLIYPAESLFSDSLAVKDSNERVTDVLLTFKRKLGQHEVNFKSAGVGDDVYDYAANKLAFEGVSEPYINTSFKDPKMAIMFMEKSVDALIRAGYDIEKISVAPKLRAAFENYSMQYKGDFSLSQKPDNYDQLVQEHENELAAEIEQNQPIPNSRKPIDDENSFINSELAPLTEQVIATGMPISQLTTDQLMKVLSKLPDSKVPYDPNVAGLSQANRQLVHEAKKYFTTLLKKANEKPEKLGRHELDKLNTGVSQSWFNILSTDESKLNAIKQIIQNANGIEHETAVSKDQTNPIDVSNTNHASNGADVPSTEDLAETYESPPIDAYGVEAEQSEPEMIPLDAYMDSPSEMEQQPDNSPKEFTQLDKVEGFILSGEIHNLTASMLNEVLTAPLNGRANNDPLIVLRRQLEGMQGIDEAMLSSQEKIMLKIMRGEEVKPNVINKDAEIVGSQNNELEPPPKQQNKTPTQKLSPKI